MVKSMLVLGGTVLSVLASTVEASYISYSTVAGYFQQDNSSTVASTFNYTASNFGLINQVYDTDAAFDISGTKTPWERFENKVAALRAADPSVDYKVLYIGRHGEGYHNAAETYYGTPAWNCYWSELDGNGTVVWADAQITPNGEAQAKVANTFWKSQIATQKQSVPQSFYSSPMTRCLQTAQITWDGITTKVPTVKELFREGISQHTCDRRSNLTYIHETFPTFNVEAGFTEYDELWRGVSAETSAAQDVRSKTVLDEVFSSDENTYLSITSHSGETASMLRVLGHQVFSLVTGAVIPVLVKAETLESAPAVSSVASWSAQATCTVPPITSLAASGCVCPTGTSTLASSSSVATTTSASSSFSTTYASNSSSSATSSEGVAYTTSTVRATSTITVTSCAASVTNCPHVTTVIVDLYTTICPITAVQTPTPAAPVSYTTSTVRATSTITVTSCAASVTNCPAGPHVTTTVVDLYTTICPVTAGTTASSVPGGAASVSSPGAPYSAGNGTSIASGTISLQSTSSLTSPSTTKAGVGASSTSSTTSSSTTAVSANSGVRTGANLALLVGAVAAVFWL